MSELRYVPTMKLTQELRRRGYSVKRNKRKKLKLPPLKFVEQASMRPNP